MGDFTVTRTYIYVAGNLIDPNQNNANENNIYTAHNDSHNGTTGHGHTGATGDGPPITYTSLGQTIIGRLSPIGTIVAMYDFNGYITFGTGATFDIDDTYWALCNGQTKTVKGVAKVLPDVSGRYLVGYGTEIDGTAQADIGSAAWSAAAVGKYVVTGDDTGINKISLTHQHANTAATSVPAHYHNTFSLNAASKNVDHGHGTSVTQPTFSASVSGADGTHAHYLEISLSGGITPAPPYEFVGLTSIQNQSGGGGSDCYVTGDGAHGHTITVSAGTASAVSVTATSGLVTGAAAVSGTVGNQTGSNGDAAFSASTTVTNVDWTNAAQDIQPRSIKVRYYMRYA